MSESKNHLIVGLFGLGLVLGLVAGLHLSAWQIERECTKLNGFFVGDQTYTCSKKEANNG